MAPLSTKLRTTKIDDIVMMRTDHNIGKRKLATQCRRQIVMDVQAVLPGRSGGVSKTVSWRLCQEPKRFLGHT